MAGGGGTHRVLAEQCMHKRHPGGVMGDKREGGRRELGQLQIISPGGAHLDLHEAHLAQPLLQLEGLDAVHVLLVAAIDDHVARVHLICAQPIFEHTEPFVVELFHELQEERIRRRALSVRIERRLLGRSLLGDGSCALLGCGARGRIGRKGGLRPSPLLVEFVHPILLDEVVLLVGVDHEPEGGAREYLEN